MGPYGNLFLLSVLMVLATPINCETSYLYFSDASNCGHTSIVGRGDEVKIQGRRSSSSTTAFTQCALLFRAKEFEDKLCMKISNLTFHASGLQFQYFKSLDPNVGTPTQAYSYSSPASVPLEICDNEYEISMKLKSLSTDAKVDDVSVEITVFSMQGTRRIAYLDEDCGTTFKMRDSIIFVQNTNSNGDKKKVDLCQMSFEYVGTDPNKTICLRYFQTDRVCNFNLKILDGSQTGGYVEAHTYSCDQTQPQTWCSERTTVQFEMSNTGSTALPPNVFYLEVKDAESEVDKTTQVLSLVATKATTPYEVDKTTQATTPYEEVFSSGSTIKGSLGNFLLMGMLNLLVTHWP